jgi:hypothetical protein
MKRRIIGPSAGTLSLPRARVHTWDFIAEVAGV